MPSHMDKFTHEIEPKLINAMYDDGLEGYHYSTDDWEFSFKKVSKWKKQKMERERRRYRKEHSEEPNS